MRKDADFQPIRSLIEGCWPGEWGVDPIAGRSNCVVYRATDIDDAGHLNLMGGAERFVLPGKLQTKALRPNDILLEGSGGAPDRPVGRVALVKGRLRTISLTSNFFRFLRPKATVDPQFLTYQLVALNKSSAIWRYQQQTTGLINLKVSDYLGHPVWAPSLAQQRKVAAILTSIDTVIEKTEALIAKYQQIKAGLMHDLFTRGVLPSGQLRPSREQAPELYQESAVGWIPRTWQPTKLREVLTRIDAGWSPDCEETPPSMGEWGVLKVSSVTRGKYDPIESKTLPPTMNPDSSIEVADGDVILTRANGVAELVGLTVQVRNTPPKLMLSDKLLRLVSIESSLAKDFLALLMQSNSIKTQIDGVMSGSSGQRNISQAHLKDFDCPLPPMEEQLQIARRMGCIEIVLEREEFGRRKLYRQKLGLMQDLLTGKVPVKVDAEAPELVGG